MKKKSRGINFESTLTAKLDLKQLNSTLILNYIDQKTINRSELGGFL